MIDLVFHQSAEREFIEAAKFYEKRAAGLGRDFIHEVERTLGLAMSNPAAARVFTGEVRRRLLRRFPFAILYQFDSDNLTVIAIMHLRRRPNYWKRRVER